PARVFDHHGMTETGPVTHECPKQPGVLHVLEPAYFAEVIEPKTGKPAAPGQIGELVLTTLGRTSSPILRYRTGDLVKPIHQPATINLVAAVATPWRWKEASWAAPTTWSSCAA